MYISYNIVPYSEFMLSLTFPLSRSFLNRSHLPNTLLEYVLVGERDRGRKRGGGRSLISCLVKERKKERKDGDSPS